ncbi:MAG: hypothetical protein A2754_00720 [Candidatus Magasanikbacteria bacterium RIFCSPHIGHO2_01_FULL_47_8]|uniref:Amine oxidase domain-containing protein n=1 Tax=Candidatus Magasanikbacteria bacterium RIFCSPHIGHO2_01_FULL_47_8 TaxID=1798673 RepID=A0A1F6MEK6_9BACT|nr:MAG: hypothetical protein A2754_00720 [Candidatus Magasanikbacteria bacterium RIFCSPHIGHO2_01_FULL_47_8]
MTSDSSKEVIIIGGGMSGLGAGIKLQEQGFNCTILEAQPEAGGLAGFFTVQNKYFPLGYHHILYQDEPLIATLKKMGLYSQVVWKKGRVLFAVNNKVYDLTNPLDFIRFPLPWLDKLRFVKLMGFCLLKNDWESVTEDARTWLTRIAGPKVREVVFDPLMDIKYGLGPEHLSASWIGSRLHYQEFSKPLGFIPGTDWTKLLVDALIANFKKLGGKIFLNAPAQKITASNSAYTGVEYKDSYGTVHSIPSAILLNTAPPHIFLSLSPFPEPQLEKITYLDALSLILETDQKLPRELYMLACLNPRYSFGGIFALSSLNPTLGVHGGTVLNFFTTLTPKYEHLRHTPSEKLLELYQADFEKLFGFKVKPLWHHLTLVKNYSPRFLKDYKNPDCRSKTHGIYFAGNYLTHPAITSTGSALASGEKAADCILQDYAG